MISPSVLRTGFSLVLGVMISVSMVLQLASVILPLEPHCGSVMEELGPAVLGVDGDSMGGIFWGSSELSGSSLQ